MRWLITNDRHTAAFGIEKIVCAVALQRPRRHQLAVAVADQRRARVG